MKKLSRNDGRHAIFNVLSFPVTFNCYCLLMGKIFFVGLSLLPLCKTWENGKKKDNFGFWK